MLNDSAAIRFWSHHEKQGTPWLGHCLKEKDGFVVHPVSLYGDECEYTATKEKVLMIYLSLRSTYVLNEPFGQLF